MQIEVDPPLIAAAAAVFTSPLIYAEIFAIKVKKEAASRFFFCDLSYDRQPCQNYFSPGAIIIETLFTACSK